ncbi:uncharacterized protein LOC122374803 isoform X2 [Amphibalanus amphitrite]|uniref:uncharacterized protein LOC122374803 isoform X2 n=1 Tax=Amphibalanus amphitrite TaxID=1232801 RepID=UPI001C927468|nr:uncharacterized protein LOC122374803 isoform X2 [Amphibalanus amphitrite]
MNRDDEEDKTNKKKSQSRSRTRESSGSSDPDFETSAAVGGRRGGYATRRTRQVESDPPPHDLSRILPRDPPDCLRRGTKRKSQSSPRLLCFDPAPEDTGGGPVPVAAGGASTSAGGASTSAGGASNSAGGASTSAGGASTSSGGPSTAAGGPSTSAASGGRDSATPNVAAGGSREGLDLPVLGSRVSTPTAGPSLGQLYKIRLAVAAASRSAGASRPAGGSVDVSSVSSVVSTPEGSASAPWADTETDSQPPRLGSPEASTPAASSASASPTFGPPLLCPVVERLPEALAAAARPEASRPQPPRPASQRRKRPPARRSRSTSTTRRPPSSPLTAGPRSAFASVSAEPAEASRASSVSGVSNVFGASSVSEASTQAVAETHATGLGLLCQAAEAAEAMAAAAQTFTAAAEVSASAANAARSEPQSRAGGRMASATSSLGTAAVTSSSGIATAIATPPSGPVTAPSAGLAEETSAGPTTETSAGLARTSSAGLASTSSASRATTSSGVPGTPERIAAGGDGRSPGPSPRQGTPLKLYRVGAKTADGSCCWTTVSPHKDSARASGTAASAGPSGVRFNLEKSESGAARRSASAEGPSSTGRPRGPERTPEKPAERRRPSRSPRQNSRSPRRKPKSPRQSPRSYRQDSRSPRRDSRMTGRESARRSPRKSRSSKSPHQSRDDVSEETMAQAEDSVQGAAALQQEAGSSHAVLRNLMEQPRSYGHRSVELPRPAEPLPQETLQNVPAYQQAAGRPHETADDLPGVAERLDAEIHQQPRAECHGQGLSGPHGAELPHSTELVHHGTGQLHHDSERLHYDSGRLHYGTERPHHVPEQLHQDTQQLHHDMEAAHPGADERRHGLSHSHHDTERSYRATEIPHDAAATHYQTGSLPLDTREVHHDSETLRPGIARPGRGEEALRLEVQELHVGTEYHYQNFEKQQNVECGHDQEWQQTAAEAVHQGDADPRELDSLLQETINFHEGQESIGMAGHHQSIAGSSHSDVKPIDIGYENDRLEAASFARSRDIPQHHAQHAAAQVPQRQHVPGSAHQDEEGPYPSPWGSYQTPEYHAQGPDALQDRCEHPNQEQETHQQVKSPHRDTEGAHRNTDDLSMKSVSPPPAVEAPLVHEDGAMQGAEDLSKKSAGEEEDVLEEARTGLHYRKKRASNLSADSSMNASTEHPMQEVRPAMVRTTGTKTIHVVRVSTEEQDPSPPPLGPRQIPQLISSHTHSSVSPMQTKQPAALHPQTQSASSVGELSQSCVRQPVIQHSHKNTNSPAFEPGQRWGNEAIYPEVELRGSLEEPKSSEQCTTSCTRGLTSPLSSDSHLHAPEDPAQGSSPCSDPVAIPETITVEPAQTYERLASFRAEQLTVSRVSAEACVEDDKPPVKEITLSAEQKVTQAEDTKTILLKGSSTTQEHKVDTPLGNRENAPPLIKETSLPCENANSPVRAREPVWQVVKEAEKHSIQKNVKHEASRDKEAATMSGNQVSSAGTEVSRGAVAKRKVQSLAQRMIESTEETQRVRSQVVHPYNNERAEARPRPPADQQVAAPQQPNTSFPAVLLPPDPMVMASQSPSVHAAQLSDLYLQWYMAQQAMYLSERSELQASQYLQRNGQPSVQAPPALRPPFPQHPVLPSFPPPATQQPMLPTAREASSQTPWYQNLTLFQNPSPQLFQHSASPVPQNLGPPAYQPLGQPAAQYLNMSLPQYQGWPPQLAQPAVFYPNMAPNVGMLLPQNQGVPYPGAILPVSQHLAVPMHVPMARHPAVPDAPSTRSWFSYPALDLPQPAVQKCAQGQSQQVGTGARRKDQSALNSSQQLCSGSTKRSQRSQVSPAPSLASASSVTSSSTSQGSPLTIFQELPKGCRSKKSCAPKEAKRRRLPKKDKEETTYGKPLPALRSVDGNSRSPLSGSSEKALHTLEATGTRMTDQFSNDAGPPETRASATSQSILRPRLSYQPFRPVNASVQAPSLDLPVLRTSAPRQHSPKASVHRTSRARKSVSADGSIASSHSQTVEMLGMARAGGDPSLGELTEMSRFIQQEQHGEPLAGQLPQNIFQNPTGPFVGTPSAPPVSQTPQFWIPPPAQWPALNPAEQSTQHQPAKWPWGY